MTNDTPYLRQQVEKLFYTNKQSNIKVLGR